MSLVFTVGKVAVNVLELVTIGSNRSISSPPNLHQPIVPRARENSNHRSTLSDGPFPWRTPFDAVDVGDSVSFLLGVEELDLRRGVGLGCL